MATTTDSERIVANLINADEAYDAMISAMSRSERKGQCKLCKPSAACRKHRARVEKPDAPNRPIVWKLPEPE